MKFHPSRLETTLPRCGVLVLVAVMWTCGAGFARAQDEEPAATTADDLATLSGVKLWSSHIQPLLMEHCQKCHGGAKAEAGLDLRTPQSILKGGDSGPAIVPGKPEESRLVQMTAANSQTVMPPESAGLSQDDRILLSLWITRLAADSNAEESWPEAATDDPPTLELPAASMPPTVVIDYLLAQAWTQNQWEPTPVCDDRTFVRRLYLDLAGRIPTQGEVEEFLADTDSHKREQLVDALLNSAQYAEHYATLFDAILMGRKGEQAWRERNEQGWYDFLRGTFAENRPWNETLRQIALARPETSAERGAAWFLFERRDNYQQMAEAIAPAMFGIQIQCAQCHDHPLAAEIKQAHYWGLVAFFARGKNQMTPLGPRIAESAVGAYEQFTDISGNSYPNLLAFLDRDTIDDHRPEEPVKEEDRDDLYRDPIAVDGKTDRLPRVPQFSRRQAFADQVLAEHPRVATAMVNRLWALMMGRGLVHPVDKIDSVHPSQHPELFAWLARDFEQHNFDIRRTIRAIALSSAYQRQAGRPTPATPPDSFSYAIEKPLTAEVLVRSLSVGLYGSPRSNVDDVRRGLVRVFPDVLPEETITTLKQTLFLSNNPDFNTVFLPAEGSLTAELVGMTDDEQTVYRLFDRVVNRPPTDEEVGVSLAFLKSRPDRREDAVTHLVWALATSAEFRFNH